MFSLIIMKTFSKDQFCVEHQNLLCYLKFHFQQKLCGAQYQYAARSFPFFLKKSSPKKQKSLTLIV